MPDPFLDWNGDFVVSATGGLLLASGDDFSRQRIVRRLCTSVRGYLWHQSYGAGLLQKIGTAGNLTALKALIRSQIALESSVAATPAPQTVVTEDANNPNIFYVVINYTSAASGQPVRLTFNT